jgi:hypothetical protein
MGRSDTHLLVKENAMAAQSQIQQQAVDGIAAVERSIIERAEREQLTGVRLEWNEDLDFGHLMDPVPVVAITRDGRTVEEHFSISEMADFASHPQADTVAKIDQIVQALTQAMPSEDVGDSRGM